MPGDRLPKDGRGAVTILNEELLKDQETEPVTWQLDWITREVKEEAGG